MVDTWDLQTESESLPYFWGFGGVEGLLFCEGRNGQMGRGRDLKIKNKEWE